MDKNEIYQIVYLVSFTATILLSFWLIKRAKPEKRIHWLVGCSIISVIWLGIYYGPIAVLGTIALLGITQKGEDKPMLDIRNGILVILGSGLGIVAYASLMLLGIGGVYWLWIAIQLGSFSMFLLGLFPLAYIVTAPVGAYSLIFGTPQWVLNAFG